MGIEINPFTPEENNPQTITIFGPDGSQIIFMALKGLGFRPVLEGVKLGKRYKCSQRVDIKRPDPTKEDALITTSEDRFGVVTTPDGKEINLGCGMEVLCTKASTKSISCHGMPMILQVPKPLPSSD